MILKASHHPVIYPFFKFYSIWKIRRNFHEVLVKGNFEEKKMPVLIISNHISWWDGFWVMYLNMKFIHRKFYFMMLEEQLKRHIFFNKTGGYSIRKGTRSVLETLNYTAELLEDKDNIVLMFPQGGIESIYNQEICFENGLKYILRKAKKKVQIIFLVNMVDYFSHPRPGLNMYIMEYKGTDLSIVALEKDYRIFYSGCLKEQAGKKSL